VEKPVGLTLQDLGEIRGLLLQGEIPAASALAFVGLIGRLDATIKILQVQAFVEAQKSESPAA
jgi:hypothetical protein